VNLRLHAAHPGTGSPFIDPGHPWQNGYVETVNRRLRDEYVNGQLFEALLEAKVLLEDFRIDCIENRAHSAPDWRTTAEFVDEWLTKQSALAS
jgi:transposase InsO family protein